ncbi:MAG: metallophosphoesterase [Desulfobacteraceae bacterium]|nr:MAG: metallophosphoesterase [Desulfobacteraceae bacterium]
MHLYAFFKIKKAVAIGFPTEAIIVCFMILMVLSPILVRLAEKYEFEGTGMVLAYAGYTWMGFLFIFFAISLAMDFLQAIIPSDLKPSSLLFLLTAVFLSVILTLYGIREAMDVRTEHITIVSPKIKEPNQGIRIVQISDVHLGLLFREQRLRKVVERVKEADPDVLVSTGDLVDGQTDGLSGVLEMLKKLKPRYGKFAVTGNHEFYAGLGKSLDFTRDAGFMVLRNKAATLPGIINLAGVDDPVGRRNNPSADSHEAKILSPLPGDLFTVLLKHRPHVDKNAHMLFDLQLSGHTHKGQIFPFSLLVRLAHKRLAGLHTLPSGSSLYISRGSGTWGPPLRILSPPEVTVIDIAGGE